MLLETLLSLVLGTFISQYPLTMIHSSQDGDKILPTTIEAVVNSATKNTRRFKPQKIDTIQKSLGLKSRAKAAIVVDQRSGSVLFEKNAEDQRSLASLSKLMSTLVFLEHNPGWNVVVEMREQYKREGSNTKIQLGDTVTVRDLFNLMLIASRNDAVMALVSATGMSQYKFVQLMNEKAEALGLRQTVFVEPTGLNPLNRSSARDIAIMLHEVLKTQEARQATTTLTYFFRTKKLGQSFAEVNTNTDLLGSYLQNPPRYEIIGGKTGYIEDSGYCLASAVKNREGGEILAVVLGAETRLESSQELKSLIAWTFANYAWREE